MDKVVKIASIVGTILSIGGTLLSGWAGEKKATATIAELVKKEVTKP